MLVSILIIAVLALIFLAVWREWKYQKEKIALRSKQHQLTAIQGKNKILEEALEEAISMSEIDPLTKAYNQRGLNRQVDASLAHSIRYDRPVSLIMVDVDDFKSVNDEHGHFMGNRVLRSLAETLTNNTRASDIVARWGGDEMAILLPETDEITAVEIAKKIRSTIADHDFRQNGGPVRFTVSIGVACFPESATDREALELKADKAMYASKIKGKNCVTVATSLDTIP